MHARKGPIVWAKQIELNMTCRVPNGKSRDMANGNGPNTPEFNNLLLGAATALG